MPVKTRSVMHHFGVEIQNIDLSKSIPSSVFEEVRTLYFQHSMLLFREQRISPAD